MSTKTTPLLAGQFVRLAKTNGPRLLLVSVEPMTRTAWVTYTVNGDVGSALLAVADLEPYI